MKNPQKSTPIQQIINRQPVQADADHEEQLISMVNQAQTAPQTLSSAAIGQLQRSLGNQATQTVLQRALIQRDSYAYGAANTTPHVHTYGGDSHLKISHRGRVRRYNIVQDGKRHTQADEALEAAANNATLLQVITDLLENY